MSSGFPTRSDTNRPVESEKQAISLKFGFKKKRDCTVCVAKSRALISFAVTAKLISAFVFFRIGKNPVYSRCGSYSN